MERKVATFSVVVCACLSYMTPAFARESWNTCVLRKFDPIMSEFSLTKYAGRWFYQATFDLTLPQIFYLPIGKCFQEVNTVEDDGLRVTNVWTSLNENFYNAGTLRQINGTHPSKLAFAVNYRGWNMTLPYWVLQTDYDNFAVVYVCLHRENQMDRDFSWILSRKPKLAQGFQEKVEKVVSSIGLQMRQFRPVVQDCGDISCEDEEECKIAETHDMAVEKPKESTPKKN